MGAQVGTIKSSIYCPSPGEIVQVNSRPAKVAELELGFIGGRVFVEYLGKEGGAEWVDVKDIQVAKLTAKERRIWGLE